MKQRTNDMIKDLYNNYVISSKFNRYFNTNHSIGETSEPQY
jgi:hypothetical protein